MKKFIMGPAEEEGQSLFYMPFNGSEAHKAYIGHLRIDFGSNGEEWWSSWFPKGFMTKEVEPPEGFSEELDSLVNELRDNLLKNMKHMKAYVSVFPALSLDMQEKGYVAISSNYVYYIRANPRPNNYNAYIFCYSREAFNGGICVFDIKDPRKWAFKYYVDIDGKLAQSSTRVYGVTEDEAILTAIRHRIESLKADYAGEGRLVMHYNNYECVWEANVINREDAEKECVDYYVFREIPYELVEKALQLEGIHY